MAAIIWEAFKDGMGTSEFTEMYFDLVDLIQHVDNLDDLIAPFTNEEIDNIVKNCNTPKRQQHIWRHYHTTRQ
jgi:hypothetical protein